MCQLHDYFSIYFMTYKDCRHRSYTICIEGQGGRVYIVCGEPMKDETVVSVRMPNKLVDKIDRLAAGERRTRSNMILVLMEKGLAQMKRQ